MASAIIQVYGNMDIHIRYVLTFFLVNSLFVIYLFYFTNRRILWLVLPP